MIRKYILRAGLAVMLAGFIFAGPLYFSVCFAEEPKPESDSAILARHIREMKIENAIEEFSDHSFNSHLSEEQLDSILKENGITIRGGKVFYAPDSSFKIFVVYGESCGAYCNPYNKSWLHFNDSSHYVLNNAGFEGELEIVYLEDGKYLVIETGWARPASVYSIEYGVAKVVSLSGHNMIPAFVHKDELDDEYAMSHDQENFIESERYMRYDPKKQRLNYQYANDLSYCCGVDSAFVYKGYYQYEKGKFIQKDEKKTYIKVTNE